MTLTCRQKIILKILIFIFTAYVASHGFAAGQSNSETSKAIFGHTPFTRKVLTEGKTEHTLYAVPGEDSSHTYSMKLFFLWLKQERPSAMEIDNLVDAMIYDTTVIPSSSETRYEWEEISRVLVYLGNLAQPDSSDQIHPAFIEYLRANKLKLHTAISNVAFTLNSYPGINLRQHFWANRAYNEIFTLLEALRDHHGETDEMENTAFGHLDSVLEECHREAYLHKLFKLLSKEDNSWLSTARLSHFILRYLNTNVTEEELQIHDRDPIQIRPLAKRFLKNEEHILVIKAALSQVIKKMESLSLPYWRYKATEYVVALMHSLEVDYNLPVTAQWLDIHQKTILGRNAKLFDWALAVEGMCPSVSKNLGTGITCSTPPRKPKDSTVISVVSSWHDNDIHTISLYPTVPMIYLAKRLSVFGALNEQELILSLNSVSSIDQTRKLSELKAGMINTLDKLFN